MTADLTGISRATIHRLRTDFKASGRSSLATPGKQRPGKKGQGTILKRYDGFTRSAVRTIIHNFFRKNEIPTVNSITQAVAEDSNLPRMGRTTVHKLMTKMGFQYHKRQRNSMLMEREDIVQLRRKYLRAIQHHRANGRSIYYLDETWVNAGHTKQSVWHDATIKTQQQALKEGLTTGLRAPSGKGARLIVVHCGNEEGFVPNAQLIFHAKKGTKDYHEEMDGACFERWFRELLPHIKPGSIIVMDNAPYHSTKTERVPTQSSRKADIQQWLQAKGISFEANMIKVELLEIVAAVKEKYHSYRIDTIASLAGHSVLRLPPYHCELNPIEMVWSEVKGYVAKKNTSFKLPDVEKLLAEGLQKVEDSGSWARYVTHVQEVERKMWETDEAIDQMTDTDPLIINTAEDSSDSDLSDTEPL